MQDNNLFIASNLTNSPYFTPVGRYVLQTVLLGLVAPLSKTLLDPTWARLQVGTEYFKQV
jgi:hypothetical protein